MKTFITLFLFTTSLFSIYGQADSRYIASNDKQVKKLKRLEELAKEPSKKNNNLVYKKGIVKKPVSNSKENNQKIYTTDKNNNKKIIKKEVKLNKYENKTSNSYSNNRNLSGSKTNSVNRSSNINNNSCRSSTSSVSRSSNVKNNSSKTKLPKQK